MARARSSPSFFPVGVNLRDALLCASRVRSSAGDVNHIKVGDNSVIGEDCVVHVSSGNMGPQAQPTVIGDEVVVGACRIFSLLVASVECVYVCCSDPGSIVHACEWKKGSWVQSGSIVLDGAVLGENSILGPGSLLTLNKVVPDGEVCGGAI